jgi:two-component system invasion response regulator UvrY
MNDKPTIRVAIADDHPIVREGLKHILADTRDIAVAGEAETAAEAMRLARRGDCHVLVLDIVLPDRSGLEILRQIKKENPALAVLILSSHREDQYAIRALKAGAAGYLNKATQPRELINAIRQVASGTKYISAALAQDLANQIDEAHDVPPHETLSDREYQTLTLIASGKTVGTIAKELSLSVKTVSEYRSRLLTKMKLRNSAELTHYAIKNRLVEG